MNCQIPNLKKPKFHIPVLSAVSAINGKICLQAFFLVALSTILAPSALASGKTKSSPSTVPVSSKVAGPSSLEETYRQRAATNPKDAEAFEGMAILQVRRGAYADAIESYRRVLDLTPSDHDAKVGLARALALGGQYEAALKNYQALMDERPDDTDALEGIARVEMWAGRPESALPVFGDLAAQHPSDPEYAVGLARAEMRLHRYTEARKTLTTLLAHQPRDREGRLQLAYLDLYEGHQTKALRQFNRLVSEDPTDREALEGNARVAYYRGDLVYSRNLTRRLVEDDPHDVSALLLLASLERALHRPEQARTLLGRARTLDARNSDARELENSLDEDARPTLHNAFSMGREYATGSATDAEDLSTFAYESTWRLAALPRTESFVSLAYLPSQSPSGGLQGAVAPAEIFYHQTTYLAPYLTIRSGVGLVRFGPGDMVGIPTQSLPITSAGARPVGFGDIGYEVSRKLTVDFTVARNAITYTPVSTRLGVMEDRVSLGIDYRYDAKTEVHMEPYANEALTASYGHVEDLGGSSPGVSSRTDHNRGAGASITIDRKIFHRPRLSVDLGYEGLVYGYSGGGDRPYLGFFNPAFYQRHYLTTHFVGRIHGPLGFDFSSGTGVQQVERGSLLKSALLFSPAFTLKASSRLTLSLGYTNYNSSESLGTLRGNAVRLTTDWRF
jgi:Flp pilus assembly protein TadD